MNDLEIIEQLPDLPQKEAKKALARMKESHQLELKAGSQLPKTFWETCSSFANTKGGTIILGIKENLEGDNEISGLPNPDQIQKDLWNGMNNQNKINLRVLQNEDLLLTEVDGKSILVLLIKEVGHRQKPVFLNGKLENTYIRTGDGDRKATREEIGALIRNSSSTSEDYRPLENYSLDDLDLDSLQNFKDIVCRRFSNRNLSELSEEDFLVRIGAAIRDRKSGQLILYPGTVLFLGKTNVIQELYPNFHLDYFEFNDKDHDRWYHRISDNDFLYSEINLFSFYTKVSARLETHYAEKFSLDKNMVRKPENGLTLTALREALVNSLVHADYLMPYISVKIEARPHQYIFSNPGEMLISERAFFDGGQSFPRNQLLMKLFGLAGFSERQGFGGSQIYRVVVSRDYKKPDLSTDLEKTTLTIWTDEAKDLDRSLSQHEKDILAIFDENEKQNFTFSELRELSGFSDYHLRKALRSLIDKSYLSSTGRGRGAIYIPEY